MVESEKYNVKNNLSITKKMEKPMNVKKWTIEEVNYPFDSFIVSDENGDPVAATPSNTEHDKRHAEEIANIPLMKQRKEL